MYYPLIKIALYSLLRGRPVQLSNISDSLGSVNYIIMSVFVTTSLQRRICGSVFMLSKFDIVMKRFTSSTKLFPELFSKF